MVQVANFGVCVVLLTDENFLGIARYVAMARAARAEGIIVDMVAEKAEIAIINAAANVPFVCLTNYPSLISLAVEKGYVTKEQENILLDWRNSPSTWTGK